MAQVIEVRFIHPETKETLSDQFTEADTHREAVELALAEWTASEHHLTSFSPVEGVTQGKHHPRSRCWAYLYWCGISSREGNRQGLALLYTQYPTDPSKEVLSPSQEEEEEGGAEA